MKTALLITLLLTSPVAVGQQDYHDANIELAGQCMAYADILRSWVSSGGVKETDETRAVIAKAERIAKEIEYAHIDGAMLTYDDILEWYDHEATPHWNDEKHKGAIRKRLDRLAETCRLIDEPRPKAEADRRTGA